ncbi:hypothetical protein MHJ92_08320 [Corynebacterium amycolatum]|uniref:hypothetical protein n=1 Tax=Corynebacterium amycolatum TaxID=43765 RepID=UPI001EF5F902|nr:hypothetical protein [Corynebacterium amycolatum]MCG7270021.1 hypothetical protein [Corynebacterium amycolatum]
MPINNSFSIKSITEAIKLKVQKNMADETRKYRKIVEQRTDELNKCKRNHSELIKNAEKALKAIENDTAALDKAKKRIQGIPHLIRTKHESIQYITQNISELRIQLNSTKQLLNQIDLQISGLVEPVNTSTYEAELSNYRRQHSALEIQIKSANARIKTLEKKFAQSEQNYKSSCEKLELFDWDDEGIPRNQLRANFAILERQADDAQYYARQNKRELDDALSALSRISAEKAHLVEPIDDGRFAREYAAYEEKLNNLRAKRTSINEEIESIIDKISKLDHQLSETRTSIAIMEQEKTELETTIPEWVSSISKNRELLDDHYPQMLDELSQDLEAAQQALSQAQLMQRANDKKLQDQIRESINDFLDSQLVNSGYIDAIEAAQAANDKWNSITQDIDTRYEQELISFRTEFDADLKDAERHYAKLKSQKNSFYQNLRSKYITKLKSIDEDIQADCILDENEYYTHNQQILSYSDAVKIDESVQAPDLPSGVKGNAFFAALPLGTLYFVLVGGGFSTDDYDSWVYNNNGTFVLLLFSSTALITYITYRFLLNRKINKNLRDTQVTLTQTNPIMGNTLDQCKLLRSSYLREMNDYEERIKEANERRLSLRRKQEQRQNEADSRRLPEVSSVPFKPFRIDSQFLTRYIDTLANRYASGHDDTDIPDLPLDIIKSQAPNLSIPAISEAWEHWSKSCKKEIEFTRNLVDNSGE